MSGADADRHAEAKANEMYWGSDLSVNQIAEQLDLSKSTLYGMVHPRPTGLACPACLEELVYPNRTARDRALVACGVCGWEGEEAEAEAVAGEAAIAIAPTEALSDGSPDEAAAVPDGGSSTIVAGALLGAAAALALILWVRRR
jgi:predicted RNA-binding Zn-ribbon protein involved in translation (DUF1610 family)